MNKLDKIFSFHISETEKQAIEIIRVNNFNVSRFLRGELRKFSDQLRLQNDTNDDKVEGGN